MSDVASTATNSGSSRNATNHADIKRVVDNLCTILGFLGCEKVLPEDFRLAKFDSCDVIPLFWRLLFQVLYIATYDELDSACSDCLEAFSPAELKVFVKRELISRGYATDLHPGSGSRDLLLNLCWLVAKEEVIDRFCERCCVLPAGLDRCAEDESTDDDIPADLISPRSGKRIGLQPGATHEQQLRYTLWLNGQLQLNLRRLRSSQGPRSKKNSGEMLIQSYLSASPDLLNRNLELLSTDFQRLTRLLRWKQNEHVFWTWMESVLLERQNTIVAAFQREEGGEVEEEEEEGGEADQVEENAATVLLQHMHKSRIDLQDTLAKFRAVKDHVSRLMSTRSSKPMSPDGRGDERLCEDVDDDEEKGQLADQVTASELEWIVANVDEEMAHHRRQLSLALACLDSQATANAACLIDSDSSVCQQSATNSVASSAMVPPTNSRLDEMLSWINLDDEDVQASLRKSIDKSISKHSASFVAVRHDRPTTSSSSRK